MPLAGIPKDILSLSLSLSLSLCCLSRGFKVPLAGIPKDILSHSLSLSLCCLSRGFEVPLAGTPRELLSLSRLSALRFSLVPLSPEELLFCHCSLFSPFLSLLSGSRHTFLSTTRLSHSCLERHPIAVHRPRCPPSPNAAAERTPCRAVLPRPGPFRGQ